MESNTWLNEHMIAQFAALHSPDDALDRRRRAAGAARPTGTGSSGCRTPSTSGASTRPAPQRLMFDSMCGAGGGARARELAGRPRHSAEAQPLTTGAASARDPRRRRGGVDRVSCYGQGVLGTTVIDLSGMVPRDAGRWLLCLEVTRRRGRRRPR